MIFLTYPSNFLLEKENVNLLSLFPDKGVFSDLCSSSIFKSESGLLFWKAKDPNQNNRISWMSWYFTFVGNLRESTDLYAEKNMFPQMQ